MRKERKGKKLIAGLLCMLLFFTDCMPVGYVAKAAEIENEQPPVDEEQNENITVDNGEMDSSESDGTQDDSQEEDTGTEDNVENPEGSGENKGETESGDDMANDEDSAEGNDGTSGDDEESNDSSEIEGGEDTSDETDVEAGNEEEISQDETLPLNAEERLASMSAEGDIASGTYKDIAWVIDVNGKLTVEGTGEFSAIEGSRRTPWYNYASFIISSEISVSGITNVSYMFLGCDKMASTDLSNFDTSTTTNMSCMFRECSALTEIKLDNFHTNDVADMSLMFYGCSSLKRLDLSNFDTRNVGNMDQMFYNCTNLTDINLSSFDTRNVTTMNWMFGNCSNLTNVDLKNFNTEKTTHMPGMFEGCCKLTTLNLSNFNTDNVIYMEEMFAYCSSLEILDISSFNTSNVRNMREMFSGCSTLKSLDVSHFKTDKVTDMSSMFSDCRNLTELDVRGFNTKNVEYLGRSGVVASIDEGDVNNEEIEYVEETYDDVHYLNGMFSGCSGLTKIDVSNFNTGNVVNMYGLFSGCSNLTELDLSNFNTYNTTNMCGLFYNCNKLASIDLSSFDTSNVSDMSLIFEECINLKTIYTPYNLKKSIVLPVASGDAWHRSDGTIVTELPQNLSYSVALGRNYIPREKDTSTGQLVDTGESIFLFRDAMTGKPIKNGRVCIEEKFSGTNYYNPSSDNGYVKLPLSHNCDRVFISTYFDGYEGVGGWANLSDYRTESGIYVFNVTPRKEKFTPKLPRITANVRTSAPAVETDEGDINLFDMDMDFAMDFGKGLKSKVTFDDEFKTIKVAISLDEKDSYDTIKKEYKASGNKSGKTLDEEFENAEEKMRPGKFGNIGVEIGVSGYLEFADTGEFIEGGLLVKLSGAGSTEYRPVSTAGLAYAKFELKITAEGKALIKYVDGNLSASAVVKIEPYAKIAVGAGWSLAHAEIGAIGKLPVNLTIPYVNDQESLSIDAVFELYGEVKFFCFGNKRTAKVERNIWPAISTADYNIYGDANLTMGDNLKILPRDYLSSENRGRNYLYVVENEAGFTTSDSFRYSEISEDSGVFAENNVQYVRLSDGTEILAWIHDFGDKSSVNRTTLVYSVNRNDGNGWSAIKPVCSDTSTGDYYPDMTAEGDRAYLVWNKTSRAFDDNISVSDFSKNTDVYASVFENGTFSEPQKISESDNGLTEFSPIVAANGDSAAVAWMTNSVNDYRYTRGNNTIYVCEYKGGTWKAPVCYAQNLNYVSDFDMGYVMGNPAVVYAEDADNISDTQDGTVYYIKNGNKTMVGDQSYQAEIVAICDGILYFSGNSRIYKVSASNISRIYDTGIDTDNFSVFKNGSGGEAIIFLGQNGFESNVYASYFNDGIYTSPVPLVSDGSRVTNYSAIYNDDGTISIAYNEDEILEAADYIYGLTDMVVRKNVEPDIFFVDSTLLYNAYDVTPGNTMEFAALASNYTNQMVSKVNVSLAGNREGVIHEETLEVSIPSGEQQYVILPYTLPEHIVNQQYVLTITPVDFEDPDLADNRAECEVGFSDIVFEDPQIKNNMISGTIKNIGYQTAANVSLTIKEDNQENSPIVELLYGGDLKPGESWTFSQKLEEVTFQSIDDGKYYLLETATDSIENDYGNDSVIICSKPVMPEKISLDRETVSLPEKTMTTIHAEVLPESSTFRDVVYVSGDNSVVIVDGVGNLYAVGKGKAIVKAYTLDGGQSAECEVTVEGLEKEQYVLSERALDLEIGNGSSLSIMDENGDKVENVIWESSDENIVTVDQNGNVTAIGEGIAYLIAQIDTFVDVCIVRVSDDSISYLDCDSTVLHLIQGETLQLDITVIPENTTMDKRLTYVTDDESIVKVDASGIVTAIAPGDTVITISSVNGVQKIISVSVNHPVNYTVAFDTMGGTRVDSIEVSADRITSEEGDEYIGYLSSVPETYKEGYIFAGWYSNKNGTGEALSASTPIMGDRIYYARWQVENNYDDSEGVLPGDIPEGGIPEGLWIAGIESQGYMYTGQAVKPQVRVYDGNVRLQNGRDYSLSYKNNTKANDANNEKTAPVVIVKGKGNYSGTETAVFAINPVNLNDENIIADDITVAYNNKIQKKLPTLTYNGKKLSNKKDFTVSYPEEGADAYKAAGTYNITVAAKNGGNFTGTRTVKLTITNSRLISKVAVKKIMSQEYTGSAVEPAFSVTYGKVTLSEGTDYTAAYSNNVEVGTATVILTGIGDYAGTKKVTFRINGISLKKAEVYALQDKTYDGSEQKQNVSVGLNHTILEEGKDYEVSYANNINAGAASIIITGKGAYTGNVKKTFKIFQYPIMYNMGLEGEITAKYVKGGSRPEVNLAYAGRQLIEGKDYTISYRNNKAVTTAETKKKPVIIIKGKGNFKGTQEKEFTIESKALNDADSPVTLMVPDKAFVNKAGKYISKPVLTDADGKKLAAGKDYERVIVYSLEDGTELNSKSKVNVGTNIKVKVTGKGAYTGELEGIYRITACDFTKAKIRISPQIYSGQAITLNQDDLTVKVGKDTLTFGTDYEIVEGSYNNNVKKGTASVTIVGQGSYGGRKTVKFKITSRKLMWFWRLFG